MSSLTCRCREEPHLATCIPRVVSVEVWHEDLETHTIDVQRLPNPLQLLQAGHGCSKSTQTTLRSVRSHIAVHEAAADKPVKTGLATGGIRPRREHPKHRRLGCRGHVSWILTNLLHLLFETTSVIADALS